MIDRPDHDSALINWFSTSGLRLVIMGACLGAVYGLLEGAAIASLSFLPGALSWRNANTPDALWFAPLFYAVVLAAIAAILAALGTVWKKVKWDTVLVFIAAGGGAYLLLRFPDLLWPWACALLATGIGIQAVRFHLTHDGRIASLADRSLLWLVAIESIVVGVVVGGSRIREYLALRGLEDVTGRPSVILLVIDTERADHLSAYGYERRTTPFLERLSKEGTLFELAYSHSSWTLPSHASMFTGLPLHVHKAGLPRMPYLDERNPTIARVLANNGYATGGFIANRFWTGRQTGLNRGFLHYEDMYTSLGDAVQRTILGRLFTYDVMPHFEVETNIPGRRDARSVTHDMLDWIDGLDGRPFFAFANFFDAHSPFIAPKSVRGKFGWHPPIERSGQLSIGQLDKSGDLPPASEIQRRVAGYDEGLLFIDRQIEWLYEELSRRGLLDNTAIILTGDHGESWGEHGELLHGHSLWDNQVHVPLIVRYPPSFAAGARVSHPVGNIDVAATIASLAGIKNAPFPTQTLMQAAMHDADDSVLLEVGMRAIQSANWPVSRGWVAGIAAGPLLYLQEQRGRQELYNVVRDPAEEHNLAKKDSFANQRRVLVKRLSRAPLDTGLTKVDNWFVRLTRH